ncbi:MAG: NAD(P)/FAD-dependent oxidoreductase [Paracoccaceae bacterium]
MPKVENFDAIILGGGAAGLMCAQVAGQRGRRVLLIEHAEKPGKKILISGGGRCNFTNIHTDPGCFISSNPHFVKSALSQFTAQDFIAMVDRYHIAWHEKTLGQLFCDGSAREIVKMLLAECAKGAVEIALGDSISDVAHSDGQYRIRFGGRIVTAPALVIATGGQSIPKMGASGFAYDLARQFGLKVIAPTPALVPMTLGANDQVFRDLSGVSADVIARVGNTRFREAALFTHKGLSGPVILQISSYWSPGVAVGIDFLPDLAPGWLIATKQGNPKSGLKSALGQHLPARLAEVLAAQIDLPLELANIPDRSLFKAETRLSDWQFMPTGTEGFAKAEVTSGGISTAELSSKTLESKRMKGLFMIGEAVDVTGWLGGYNFQWAWSSGAAAGKTL